MKKILAIALCVVLCFCMAVPAFAAGTPEAEYQGQNGQQDVNITVSGKITHVYLVDIVFTSPTFTYSTGSKWNPENYKYEPINNAEWTGGEGTVKITNHSDLPINYKVEKENVVKTYGDLDIEVTGGTGKIEKCEVGMTPGQQNATATYKVIGTPTVSEITAQKLGEIKVTITKVN